MFIDRVTFNRFDGNIILHETVNINIFPSENNIIYISTIFLKRLWRIIKFYDLEKRTWSSPRTHSVKPIERFVSREGGA